MTTRWCVALVTLTGALPNARQQVSVEQQTSGTKARLQAVSVVSDRIVWASGIWGTFIRTTDGGATWLAGRVPGADSLEFRDVHGFDANRAVLLAAGPGQRSRIYHTANGGGTWSLVFTNYNARAFYDCFDFQGHVGIVVSDAVDGAFPLLRTTDGGLTWARYEPPGYARIRGVVGEGAFAASGTCLTMRPDGSAWIGTAVGGRVIRFGPDRSEEFATPIIRGPAAGPATIAFRNDTLGIAAGGDMSKLNDYADNVIVTRDGGRTWKVAGRPPFTGAIFGVAYVGPRPVVVVAVGPKGAAWSPDHGRTWTRLDDNDYWGIGFSKTGVGWLSGPNGRIARVTFRD